MGLPLDNIIQVLHHCTTDALLRCAQTSHAFQDMVSAELRRRFMALVYSFFGCRSHDFLVLLSTHHAIISGSTALAFLSWPDSWNPGDLDIYVSDNEYPQFTQALSDLRLADLETDFGTRNPTPYEGIKTVRRYLTPTRERVDVIRSSTPNPASPLLSFWGSLVVNFLSPRGAVCAFPARTLNHKAFVADISHSEKLVAARMKYEARGFKFNMVDSWRPASLTDAKGRRIFSDTPIMAIDFLSVWPTESTQLPIVRAGHKWVLHPNYPNVISGKKPPPPSLNPALTESIQW